jgi:integrase
MMNIFEHCKQLSLSQREQRSLPELLLFLEKNVTPLGQILLGLETGPWSKKDVLRFETLVLKRVPDAHQIADFLSITRSAARFWSVHEQKRVRPPRYYVPPPTYVSPFATDYAASVALYHAWREKLAAWIQTVFRSESNIIEDRDLLLRAFITSAILHGGALGEPILTAIICAIPQKHERTFAIGGRVHIELRLPKGGITEAETRIWIPDALTATLWNSITTQDVGTLLVPDSSGTNIASAKDNAVFNRLKALFKGPLGERSDQKLGSLAGLRRCAYAVAHVELRPVIARYANSEIPSTSLPRKALRRLFPSGDLIQFPVPQEDDNVQDSAKAEVKDTGERCDKTHDPAWVEQLLEAARAKSPKKALDSLASDPGAISLTRRLAEFGISLLSTVLSSGKHVGCRDLPNVLQNLAKSLGPLIEDRDIADYDTQEALNLYRNAIHAQPTRKRSDLIQWIVEFDFYLCVRVEPRAPVSKSELPWPTESESGVDANLATHEEFVTILEWVDRLWDIRDSERRKRIVRLVIILEFRCGLRRSEVCKLRICDALLRGSPELLIWSRRGNQLKTRNAKRWIPISALLSIEEIEELRSWYNERVEVDRAGPEDYLFALPEEKLQQIPKSLLEKVNTFLRRLTASSGNSSQEGIREHILRHAFGGWLFISAMLSELEKPPILFPYLPQTSAWISRGPVIKESLFRHAHITQKHPYMVAYLSGHADFGTTAHSYIHLFPWLLSAFLNCSIEMKPEIDLIKLASRTPPSTLRNWINQGGSNFIPLQLMKQNPAIRVEITEIKTGGAVLPAPSPIVNGEAVWLETAWNALWNWFTKSSQPDPNRASREMFSRADYISNLISSSGKFRHSMETWSSDTRDPNNNRRIACPAKPKHERNISPPNLCAAILQMHQKDPQLVRDATEIYVRSLEKANSLDSPRPPS